MTIPSKPIKNHLLPERHATSLNLDYTFNIMDALTVLDFYQRQHPSVWNQHRQSTRQTWMASQWHKSKDYPFIKPAPLNDLKNSFKDNIFYTILSWNSLHLLPQLSLQNSSQFDLWNDIFIKFYSHHHQFISSPQGSFIHPKFQPLPSTSYSSSPNPLFNFLDPLIHELPTSLNPSPFPDSDAPKYQASLNSWARLMIDCSPKDISVHPSMRSGLDRYRSLLDWVSSCVSQGLSSLPIPGTTLHLQEPSHSDAPKSENDQLNPILYLYSKQLSKLQLAMKPENLQSDDHVEKIQHQWIECWIDNQPSDLKRKIRADRRKNLAPVENPNSDALLNEIFRTFTHQNVDDIEGSNQLKETLKQFQLSNAGWKTLHKSTPLQSLILRSIMTDDQWRAYQLVQKSNQANHKISIKDRTALLAQKQQQQQNELKMQWISDVLTASSEYQFSAHDTQTLIKLISDPYFSSWAWSYGTISSDDVLFMNDDDWNRWWDGLSTETQSRQQLWKPWMKDAVDYFSTQGQAMSVNSMNQLIRQIWDVQKAEASHDFFTQLLAQSKKTPFRTALKWHDQWVQRLNQQTLESKSDTPWESPWTSMQKTQPFHSSGVNIQELNSERLLAQEGLNMHHCVGSSYYFQLAQSQSILVFHLENSQNRQLCCTLTFEKNPTSDSWVIQQNKGKYNSHVHDPLLLLTAKTMLDQLNQHDLAFTQSQTVSKIKLR